MEVQMDDSVIFFAGIFTTVLFLIGYGITIKEFKELEEERGTDRFRDDSSAEIEK